MAMTRTYFFRIQDNQDTDSESRSELYSLVQVGDTMKMTTEADDPHILQLIMDDLKKAYPTAEALLGDTAP